MRRALFGGLSAAGLWLLAELIVTFAAAEGLAAYDAPPPSPEASRPSMPGSPYLIYELRPGVHTLGGATAAINSLGLRGPEPTPPRPNMRRLMTTGDSSIFGFGVSDGEVFSDVAAASLGAGVEAINAATPGYSTLQTINLLKLRALALEPDLIVIGNLWSDNNFDLFVDREVLAEYQAYQQGLIGRARGLLQWSSIYRALDWQLRVRPAVERVLWIDHRQGQGRDGPHSNRRRVEVNDYAASLERLVGIASGAGAEVAFLIPANVEFATEATETGPPHGWEVYRQVMRDTADRHGALLLDVPALFRDSGRSSEELFIDVMHPSVLGHQLMGAALAELLRERGWPAEPAMQGGSGTAVPQYVDTLMARTR
ncbi:MAG: lysophospholipase L1-like esterase [Myxococcota bacterium]|jgi:lysophospholipase L1-like esterase